jgi:hypothetical protein
MRRTILLILMTLLVLPILAACTPTDQAARAVEDYYQALVDKDAERAISLACADWELNAQMETDSFQAVDARLDGLTCQQSGADGDMLLVTCEGQIAMSYNGEDQFLDLSRQTFQVENRGGDYLFCGYR